MFRIAIKLGSTAMQDHEDVADALAKVVDSLRGSDRDAGQIKDANGDTVGAWQFDTEGDTSTEGDVVQLHPFFGMF